MNSTWDVMDSSVLCADVVAGVTELILQILFSPEPVL